MMAFSAELYGRRLAACGAPVYLAQPSDISQIGTSHDQVRCDTGQGAIVFGVIPSRGRPFFSHEGRLPV